MAIIRRVAESRLSFSRLWLFGLVAVIAYLSWEWLNAARVLVFLKSISPAASDKQIDVEFLFQSTSPIKLVCQDVLVQRETEESDI